MAKGTFQHIVIGGNLGQDPELRHTQGGTAVANMSVGVTDYAGKDQSGQAKFETEWFKVIVWGKQAEAISSYAMKGTKVQVSGRMNTRKWTDQQGVDRYSSELVANEVNIIANGRPPAQGQQGNPQGFNQGFGQPAPNQGAQAQGTTNAPSQGSQGAQGEWLDDSSIPF